jgi:prephenate dehydrogenase
MIADMRIAFLGRGLIGGSIARAVRLHAGGEAELVAWTPGGAGPAAALAEGVLDGAAATLEGAIDGADLVVLAAPPRACLDLLDRVAGARALLSPKATVTDVASTKVRLTERAAAAGMPYVGGHPMAGRETSGYGATDPSLFEGRHWVVTEPVAGGDPAVVQHLAAWCGASVVRLTAAEHDELVAAISHLPLVVSAALVEAVAGAGPGVAPADWPAARALAAGGWRDMTRLARGDATMGADIAATNAAALARRLRAYRGRLDAWIEALEAPDGPDVDALRAAFAHARDRLEE